MKVRSGVKKICDKCIIVRRRTSAASKGGPVLRVTCVNRKHNQRQGARH